MHYKRYGNRREVRISSRRESLSPEEAAAFGGGAGAVAGRFVFGAAFVFEVVTDADEGVADGVSWTGGRMEDQQIFAILSFELNGTDSRLFAQLVLNADAACVATDAFEAATERLGVPRLVDVVRPGDADEEEQHAEREQVFTHGVEGLGRRFPRSQYASEGPLQPFGVTSPTELEPDVERASIPGEELSGATALSHGLTCVAHDPSGRGVVLIG